MLIVCFPLGCIFYLLFFEEGVTMIAILTAYILFGSFNELLSILQQILCERNICLLIAVEH